MKDLLDKKFIIVMVAIIGLLASMFVNHDKEITMFVLGALSGIVSAEFGLKGNDKDNTPIE